MDNDGGLDPRRHSYRHEAYRGSEDDDDGGSGENGDTTHLKPKPRVLPDDLPTSLDDRRSVPTFSSETEMYDAWQGPQLSLIIILLLEYCICIHGPSLHPILLTPFRCSPHDYPIIRPAEALGDT